MRMRNGLFLLLAVAPAAMSVEAEKPKLVAFRAEARVAIDANGKPTQVEASKDLPEAIKEYIEKRVSAWSFAPPQRDGRVSAGVTYVHLGACAIPVANGYSLAIDYKGNGPGYENAYGRLLPPRYPAAAQMAGQEAAINVTYIVEADGKATLESQDFTGTGRPTDPIRKAFEVAIRDWVRQLRHSPEELAGNPVRTRLTVPVIFTLGDNPREEWLAELRKEAEESNECKMASDQQPGLMPIALDSPFQLVLPAGQGG